jgi:hypothetical protein
MLLAVLVLVSTARADCPASPPFTLKAERIGKVTQDPREHARWAGRELCIDQETPAGQVRCWNLAKHAWGKLKARSPATTTTFESNLRGYRWSLGNEAALLGEQSLVGECARADGGTESRDWAVATLLDQGATRALDACTGENETGEGTPVAGDFPERQWSKCETSVLGSADPRHLLWAVHRYEWHDQTGGLGRSYAGATKDWWELFVLTLTDR